MIPALYRFNYIIDNEQSGRREIYRNGQLRFACSRYFCDKRELTYIDASGPWGTYRPLTMEHDMSKELTLPERAENAIGFADRKAELAKLAAESVRITAITNKDGRDECHTALMKLRSTRVAIQKAGKGAREDAVAFGKAIIEKEKELIGIIDHEETRLAGLRDAWDEAREQARQLAAEAEARRVAFHRGRIAAITGVVVTYAHADADALAGAIGEEQAIPVDEGFEEFEDEAKQAKANTLARLNEMLAAATYREAEEARKREDLAEQERKLAAEREELAKARAEHDARVAAENAAAQAQRDAEDAERRQRQADEDAARELQRQQEDADRQAQAEKDAADRAAAATERVQIEALRREQERLNLAEERRGRLARIKAEAGTLLDAAKRAHELLTEQGLDDNDITIALGFAIEAEAGTPAE